MKRQRDDKLITDAITRVQADFVANHSPGSPVRPASAMDRRKSSESSEPSRPLSALAKLPSDGGKCSLEITLELLFCSYFLLLNSVR